jgi:ClpP class serine protease
MHDAFASSAKIVFVAGDTPGGDVSGCFATARELRRLADASGKLLVWYLDGQTCSAGLALAIAADIVAVPEEARLGSIGVIAELTSVKDAARRVGQQTRLITSGERKADGHPLAEITDDVEAAVQASVDYEANLFYEWVSERRGIPVETIRGWQAKIFHGQEAVDVGLADEVMSESCALRICAGQAPAEFSRDDSGGDPQGEMHMRFSELRNRNRATTIDDDEDDLAPKKCSKCDYVNQATSKYCSKCGTKLHKGDADASARVTAKDVNTRSRLILDQAKAIDALNRQVNALEGRSIGGLDFSIFSERELVAYGLAPANHSPFVRVPGTNQTALGLISPEQAREVLEAQSRGASSAPRRSR